MVNFTSNNPVQVIEQRDSDQMLRVPDQPQERTQIHSDSGETCGILLSVIPYPPRLHSTDILRTWGSVTLLRQCHVKLEENNRCTGSKKWPVSRRTGLEPASVHKAQQSTAGTLREAVWDGHVFMDT